MELSHNFELPVPFDEAWDAFNDLDGLVPCVPGATLLSADGDSFTGSVKVKLGPISMTYNGTGKFVERDKDAGRIVVEAKGKDKRGNGTAGANVVAQITATNTGTAVQVTTDLSVTGKPAQFGRGVMQDVSDKLLQQFVTCLKDKVGAAEEDAAAEPSGEEVTQLASSEPAPTTEPPDAAPGTPVGEESAGDVSGPRKTPSTAYAGASAGGSPGPSSAPPPRSAPAASASYGPDDALDLGSTVLPVLARTYGRQVGAGLALLLVGWLLGRRGRR